MKTWYLPPRFLDDVTLAQEFEESYLYIKVNKLDLDLYVFLRYQMLDTELKHRDLARNGNLVEISDVEIPDYFWFQTDFGVLKEVIDAQINQLLEFWENNQNVDPDLKFTEQLMLSNSEDIKTEMEWLFHLYRKEYI